jgi:CHAT domain
MDYHDFAVRLTCRGDGGILVSVVDSPAGQLPAVPTRLPYTPDDVVPLLRGLEAAALSGSRGAQLLSPGDHKTDPVRLGAELLQALLPTPVLSLYERSRGMTQANRGWGLRLKLHLSVETAAPTAWLSELPWECLYHPREEEFVALNRATPVVRFMEVPQPARPFPLELPLRVAILPALRPDLDVLDLDAERRTIQSAWPSDRTVEVVVLAATSLEKIQEDLRDGDFHVLHYMGHGEFDREHRRGSLSIGAGSRGMPGDLLARFLRGVPTIRLVVLNACETGHSAGVAADLVRSGLPAVVAMQLRISDKAALAFSRALYRRLAKGDPIDAAVTEGRLAILAAVSESWEWLTPVLFERAPDGRLFELPEGKSSSRGLESFWSADWRAAAEHFRTARRLNPLNDEAQLYYCIATLCHTFPGALSLPLADDLNAALCAVLEAGNHQERNLARRVLGVLRLDYYESKHVHPKGYPTPELLHDLTCLAPSPEERQTLRDLKMSNSTRRRCDLGAR